MFDDICKEIQECKDCKYNSLLVNTYKPEHGWGKYSCHTESPDAKIMIVGQNPSYVRFPAPKNHSLSGKQGDIFREIFGKENLILTNLIPYSTINNKVNDSDANHGMIHLLEQINYWKPSIIICLGAVCKKAFGSYFSIHDSKIFYMKHPDCFLSYNQRGWDQYVKEIIAIREKYKKDE